ncbi:MAG TPA: toll/interleukin-1 receptor domain-containing protein [Roseiarcus sp.]|nr:toll/interleukin-1 receptor domain-containing protein [Roseiarcus sp.]
MPGGVFISYRREDSRGFAGRIYDRLSDRLGSENIFFDVDNIAPGLDFVEVLTERVASCDALVAVIGKDWLASVDRTGRRRLDDAEDFVRVEIEAALKRGVRVIPVLVENAAMPQADELPESLRKLARRQGIAIDHARFNSDVERLLRVLSEIEEEAHRARPPDAPAASRSEATAQQAAAKPIDASRAGATARRGVAPLAFAALAVVALLALGAITLLRGRAPEPAAPPSAAVTHPSDFGALGAPSLAASDPTTNAAPLLIADPSALLGSSAKLLNAAASNSAAPASPTSYNGAGKEVAPDDLTPHQREVTALQKQVEEQFDRLNSPTYDGVGKDAALKDLARQMEKLNSLQKQVAEEDDRQNNAAMDAMRKINSRSDAEAPAEQWLSLGDFDADAKKQFAAGNYPDKAWGRCQNGVPQTGAHWSPRPAGQSFDLRGASERTFKSDAAAMTAKGFKMQSDNVFQNCDGATQHQTLWMKAG